MGPIMKFRRVNLPEDTNKTKGIIDNLTEKFSKVAKFEIDPAVRERRGSEDADDFTIKSEKEIGYEDTPWALFLNFAMGTENVASYLGAYLTWSCIYDPNLDESDEANVNFLGQLAAAVGIKLKDQRAIDLIGDEPIPEYILKLADKCIEQIEKNKNEIGQKDITFEEAIARAKVLDKIVETNSDHSFVKSTIIEGSVLTQYASYVEVIDQLENSSVEIIGDVL